MPPCELEGKGRTWVSPGAQPGVNARPMRPRCPQRSKPCGSARTTVSPRRLPGSLPCHTLPAWAGDRSGGCPGYLRRGLLEKTPCELEGKGRMGVSPGAQPGVSARPRRLCCPQRSQPCGSLVRQFRRVGCLVVCRTTRCPRGTAIEVAGALVVRKSEGRPVRWGPFMPSSPSDAFSVDALRTRVY